MRERIEGNEGRDGAGKGSLGMACKGKGGRHTIHGTEIYVYEMEGGMVVGGGRDGREEEEPGQEWIGMDWNGARKGCLPPWRGRGRGKGKAFPRPPPGRSPAGIIYMLYI